MADRKTRDIAQAASKAKKKKVDAPENFLVITPSSIGEEIDLKSRMIPLQGGRMIRPLLALVLLLKLLSFFLFRKRH